MLISQSILSEIFSHSHGSTCMTFSPPNICDKDWVALFTNSGLFSTGGVISSDMIMFGHFSFGRPAAIAALE